ncbi:MAG TPA: hypothetical protein VJR48_19955, partial [Ktedonobacterales bacterium]|nr:hypothetical protein [Ktedonobacterales bacterium]
AILVTPLAAKFLDFVPPYRPEIDKPLLNAGVMAAVAAIILTRLPSPAQLQHDVSGAFPAQALEFINTHGLAGERTFNYYGWGGYLEWKDPAVKPFVDTRTDIFEYAGVLQDYLDVTRLDDPIKLLDKRQVEWVLFPPQDPFAYFLAHTENWKVAYNDNVAEVFVRTTPPPTTNTTVAQARDGREAR